MQIGAHLITIALAAEEDLPRIFEIEQNAFTPPWSQEDLLCEILKEDSFFIVAKDEVVEGFAILRQVGDDGELINIAVDKQARRRGIGDLLVTASLEYAGEQTFNNVFLEVRVSNTAAVNLYEKHGFSTIRIRKGYYDKPTEDALIMVKEIYRDE